MIPILLLTRNSKISGLSSHLKIGWNPIFPYFIRSNVNEEEGEGEERLRLSLAGVLMDVTMTTKDLLGDGGSEGTYSSRCAQDAESDLELSGDLRSSLELQQDGVRLPWLSPSHQCVFPGRRAVLPIGVDGEHFLMFRSRTKRVWQHLCTFPSVCCF